MTSMIRRPGERPWRVSAQRMGGATAERFEADGTGTAEEIEHAGVLYPRGEHGKHGLADEVGGGAGHGSRHLDGDAPGFSGDDSHGVDGVSGRGQSLDFNNSIC